jgi:GTP-binding protein
MNTVFYQYMSDPGNWKERDHGSLVSTDTGKTNIYGLTNLQSRGTLFFGPAVEIYEGQVVGQNARSQDVRINVCKEKQLSNCRSIGDASLDYFKTPKTMALDDALEYIGDDEYVEVTPKTIRIRKMHLKEVDQKRAERSAEGVKFDF